MKTIVRNSYDPKPRDYCNTIVVDEERDDFHIFDSDGVYTSVIDYDHPQSDWNEADELSMAFIKNKPDVVVTADLDAETTEREEQDNFLHGEIVEVGNELAEEINNRTTAESNLASLISEKANKITLYSDGDVICSDPALENILTFEEIRALTQDTNNIVVVHNSNYELRFAYHHTQGEDDAVWFNATTSLDGEPYFYRIIINSNNEVRSDEHHLVDYHNKLRVHNVNINHTTSSGTWDYAFTIQNTVSTPYTQLAQVAQFINTNYPTLAIPASGTYTENGTVYIVTKISANTGTMVEVELRKITDGSIRTITTGAVNATDIVF